MDEPKQVGGTDTAPNMVEMVLGAYGCCLITGYVAQAGFRGIDLLGVDIDVEGDLDLRGSSVSPTTSAGATPRCGPR